MDLGNYRLFLDRTRRFRDRLTSGELGGSFSREDDGKIEVEEVNPDLNILPCIKPREPNNVVREETSETSGKLNKRSAVWLLPRVQEVGSTRVQGSSGWGSQKMQAFQGHSYLFRFGWQSSRSYATI